MDPEDQEEEEEIDERWEDLRKDLTYAMFHRDVSQIQSLLTMVSEVGCDEYLEAEVSSARLLLSRMVKEREASLHELQQVLTRESINEIRSTRGYQKDWKYVTKVLGKFGHEHLLNVMLDVKIQDIPVDVAMRARDIVKYIDEEKVKTVDHASVALYKWITGLADEVIEDTESGVSKISCEEGWNDNIQWRSFEDGVKESQETQKPVMLVIHKSWCGACKALKPKFAESKEIEELSSNFVMINTNDDQEPKDAKFSPDGGYIPRILFMDHTGDIQTQLYHEGGNDKYKFYYHEPNAILRTMKKASEQLKPPVITSDEL